MSEMDRADEHRREESALAATGRQEEADKADSNRRGSNRLQSFIGVVVLLLCAASVAQTAYFQGQLDQQKSCLVNYQVDLNNALQTRSQTVAEEAAATRDLLLATFRLMRSTQPESETQEEFQEAFQAYATRVTKAQETRTQNPYPPFPEGACS